MNDMSRFAIRSAVLAVAVLFVGSAAMKADTIPYPSTGSIAPAATLVSDGGTVTAYFNSASAGDTDYIEILDLTTGSDVTGFNNQPNPPAPGSTPIGSTLTLTGTGAGNIIVVELFNESYPGDVFASDPALSTDGENHGYITPVTSANLSDLMGVNASNDSLIGGVYVGMEDLYIPGADLDYNDDTLVLTGVTATPEPSSLMLLGTGLFGTAGMLFRRRQTA